LSYGLSREQSFEVNCHLTSINPVTGDVRVAKEPSGKQSQTFFRILEGFTEHRVSLISCKPVTGRSHQIRVHLLSKGLPILGDKVYGHKMNNQLSGNLASLSGQHHFLHCRTMTFKLPGREHPVCVKAGYPENFSETLDQLRGGDS
jgi:23S rRNA-/tRNA-specific pseudouridylate synthase